MHFNPLNAELNPIYHLLTLLGGATIVVVSRLRVIANTNKNNIKKFSILVCLYCFLKHFVELRQITRTRIAHI